MYMNAKRWRETKYTTRAALRKPRGLPSERAVLQNRSKKTVSWNREWLFGYKRLLRNLPVWYILHINICCILGKFPDFCFVICFSDVSFIFDNLRVIPPIRRIFQIHNPPLFSNDGLTLETSAVPNSLRRQPSFTEAELITSYKCFSRPPKKSNSFFRN